jgi:hypothetical protein
LGLFFAQNRLKTAKKRPFLPQKTPKLTRRKFMTSLEKDKLVAKFTQNDSKDKLLRLMAKIDLKERCPSCGNLLVVEEFNEKELFIREAAISGLCNKCQEAVFARTPE